MRNAISDLGERNDKHGEAMVGAEPTGLGGDFSMGMMKQDYVRAGLGFIGAVSHTSRQNSRNGRQQFMKRFTVLEGKSIAPYEKWRIFSRLKRIRAEELLWRYLQEPINQSVRLGSNLNGISQRLLYGSCVEVEVMTFARNYPF